MLKATPEKSDRQIAELVKASPTTVWNRSSRDCLALTLGIEVSAVKVGADDIGKWLDLVLVENGQVLFKSARLLSEGAFEKLLVELARRIDDYKTRHLDRIEPRAAVEHYMQPRVRRIPIPV